MVKDPISYVPALNGRWAKMEMCIDVYNFCNILWKYIKFRVYFSKPLLKKFQSDHSSVEETMQMWHVLLAAIEIFVFEYFPPEILIFYEFFQLSHLYDTIVQNLSEAV